MTDQKKTVAAHDRAIIRVGRALGLGALTAYERTRFRQYEAAAAVGPVEVPEEEDE